MKTNILILIFCIICNISLHGQSSWPSTTWANATNLTSVMDASNGVTELSGLHWNPELNRLYAITDDGVLYILQLNTTTNSFTRIATLYGLGGPEGVTQVDYSANEFYTIDENSYEIRRYSHPADFSSDQLVHKWNLLASPSPMTDTGNTGPEGIAFVPDSYLSAIGFYSTVTGAAYTSKKGMGGLMFIAHQKKGWVWVFDLNPNVTDDFAYVGKYKTNEDESCDLEFERSTGLMYILHNTGSNYLEVTNLTSSIVSGNQKFIIKNEYFIPNPSGSDNIEGFAITPKCQDSTHVSAWLCRDMAIDESVTDIKDCLRWFTPFLSEGKCLKTDINKVVDESLISIYPNPANNQLTIKLPTHSTDPTEVRFITTTGQLVLMKNIEAGISVFVDISILNKGLYFVQINQGGRVFPLMKLIKE